MLCCNFVICNFGQDIVLGPVSCMLPKLTVSTQSLSSALNITSESESQSSRVFTYFFCPFEGEGSLPLYSVDKKYWYTYNKTGLVC